MARLRTSALLPIVALFGCLGSDSATDPGSQSIPFVTVYEAQYSGIDAYRVQPVASAAEWTSLWQEIHSSTSEPPPLPPVDFAARRLLLAAIGQRPNGCHSVAVDSIVRRGETLEATLVETVPGTGCACTEAITQPLHVVGLQRSDEAIAARLVQRVASCG